MPPHRAVTPPKQHKAKGTCPFAAIMGSANPAASKIMPVIKVMMDAFFIRTPPLMQL